MKQRRARDLAVKTFLENVNNYRKVHLGCQDLREAYTVVADFSIDQAIQWETEFQQIVQNRQQAD